MELLEGLPRSFSVVPNYKAITHRGRLELKGPPTMRLWKVEPRDGDIH